MTKNNVIGGLLLTILTATTTPWWWEKLFPNGSGTASASTITPVVPPFDTDATRGRDSQPTSQAIPHSVSEPIARVPVAPVVSSACPAEKPWTLQVAAGSDRSALVTVVDKVRAADAEFRAAALFEAADGKYRIVIGCFHRFAADSLHLRFVEKQVLSTPALVTLGRSLTRRVY